MEVIPQLKFFCQTWLIVLPHFSNYYGGKGFAYGVSGIGHSPFGPSVLSASACEHAPALIFDKGW